MKARLSSARSPPGARGERESWRRLIRNVENHAPELVLDGVLVEARGRPGVELIIGGRNDPEWGPVILVGFGGVQAEILHDVRLLPPDLGHAEVISELGRLKSGALFEGWRDSPALDLAAVADIVVRFGRLLRGTSRIREVDLNPVIVRSAGEGAIALDALMLVE